MTYREVSRISLSGVNEKLEFVIETNDRAWAVFARYTKDNEPPVDSQIEHYPSLVGAEEGRKKEVESSIQDGWELIESQGRAEQPDVRSDTQDDG